MGIGYVGSTNYYLVMGVYVSSVVAHEQTIWSSVDTW
jgi:hypothetical protein